MSFYGNHYSYVAASIASIYLKKFNNTNPTLPNDYAFINEEKNLGALTENTVLNVAAGNDWIQLGVPKDTNKVGFCISHGPALREQEVAILPFNPTKEVLTSEDLLKENSESILQFGQKITIPLLDIDKAGHVIHDDNIDSVTYILPANPMESVLNRMQKIDGLDEDGKPIENDKTSLSYILTSRMDSIDNPTRTDSVVYILNDRMDELYKAALSTDEESSLQSQFDSFKDTVDEYITQVGDAAEVLNNFEVYKNALAGISNTTIPAIESKIDDIISYLRGNNSNIPSTFFEDKSQGSSLE